MKTKTILLGLSGDELMRTVQDFKEVKNAEIISGKDTLVILDD